LLFNKTHGEPFLTNPDEVGLSIGVKVFCDLAMKQFPIKNKKLFQEAVPFACYFPLRHMDINNKRKGQCMPFETALRMLSTKNNANENSIKQNYLAGVLRLHTKSLAPYDNHPWSPKFFNFNHMRNSVVQRSFRDMLLEIDTVLGYETSVNKMNFKLGADVYDRHKGHNVFLSPHAFCTAIVELIPFSTAVIEKSLQTCK
uniref:Uncharacterized protein n=1 Tax=Romanomermis culicivorax TaxID=13658 RepID=A0A915HZB9_ROMCU